MCKAEGMDSTQHRALCHFKFFVYRVFREGRHLGSLGPTLSFPDDSSQFKACRKLYEQYRDQTDDSKPVFARLYSKIVGIQDTNQIVKPFLDITGGLLLEDLPELFTEVSSGQIGGHPWTRISQEVINLRDALSAERWDQSANTVDLLRRITHNRQRPATEEFPELMTHIGVSQPYSCCVWPSEPSGQWTT